MKRGGAVGARDFVACKRQDTVTIPPNGFAPPASVDSGPIGSPTANSPPTNDTPTPKPSPATDTQTPKQSPATDTPTPKPSPTGSPVKKRQGVAGITTIIGTGAGPTAGVEPATSRSSPTGGGGGAGSAIIATGIETFTSAPTSAAVGGGDEEAPTTVRGFVVAPTLASL